ncbi:MAG: D-alanyl-D-alanine carboxypeptidase, partial [Bacteroidaceae bacterium]|nr:D-alanyl-D-alanine carboxypeptidase [Bacteroidaceae bacterium]
MTIHNVPKVLFATLLMLMLSIGAAAQWGPTLTYNIDSLLGHPMFQRTQVAVYVYDLDADTVVYDRGSRQLMRPASVMKVLTSTAALHNLGADHPFITTLSYS